MSVAVTTFNQTYDFAMGLHKDRNALGMPSLGFSETMAEVTKSLGYEHYGVKARAVDSACRDFKIRNRNLTPPAAPVTPLTSVH